MTSIVDASLIITVLNEADSITAFLDSVRRQQTLPREIVIVDGGSTDGTADLISRWVPPTGVNLVLRVEQGAGISRGRNLAVAVASHERILVTDAGTEMTAGWIDAISRSSTPDGEADVVSGFFYPVGDSFLQRTIAFTITPELREINPATFLPSSRSISFTKSAWSAVDGYPEWLDYCEDLVFDIALKDKGFRFVFRPEAAVSWSARPTMRAFIKQYYRYARGDGKAGLWAKRHTIRYAAYSVGTVLFIGGFWSPWLWLLLVVGFGGYVAKFVRRVISRRTAFGRNAVAASFLAPLIVVAGDLSKMAGYPVGVRWRARHR